MEALETLVRPLIRSATKLHLEQCDVVPENSRLKSHFGGKPYFETGEEWPKSKTGAQLDFVFQIVNNNDIELPGNIQLVQFYYDFEEYPWETSDDGWLVRIYEKINDDGRGIAEENHGPVISSYCEISFVKIKSLPDWEGIDLYSKDAANLSCVLNNDAPWKTYEKVVEKLIGAQDYQSQLGGYPRWVQGESTPKNNKGENMQLLFQIDSEDAAGLMWGDVGLIYVFYDRETEKIEFTLQCH
jgi:uncharacterized protein YwqG